nr:substrate-binding domain-containing protein [Oscillospiraceae bacterium]
MKRTLSFVLCLSMLFSMLPVSVFASDVEETVVTETIPATEATQAPETQAPTQAPVIETTAAPETAAAETAVPTEAAAEQTTAATEATEAAAETAAAEETVEPTVAEVTAPQETVPEETIQEYTYSPGEDFPDSDALFAAYVEHQFYGTEIELLGTAAGETLSGDEKLAYDALVPVIRDIASGNRSSAVVSIGYNAEIPVTFSGSGSDFDINALLNTLLSDLPYDLFWFNKTGIPEQGMGAIYLSFSASGSRMSMTVSFMVSANYSLTGEEGTFEADAAKIADIQGSVADAVTNAKAIVADSAALNDYEKLLSYKDAICNLTSYNNTAANTGNFSKNNDPWQLIHVFDGLESTKVVCEGYSKAFQYLCDLSDFRGDVTCYSVSGVMAGGTGAGSHMWNIVRINGKSYLADITNSDAGTVGANGKLFLAGKAPNSDGTYSIGGVTFLYGEETTKLWGTGANSILNLAAENYDPDAADQEPGSGAATMTCEEFLSAMEAAAPGTYTLIKSVVVSSELEVPYDVTLQIGAGGSLTVSSGANVFTENDIIIRDGGALIIEEGGTVDSWGNAYVHKGGTLTDQNEYPNLSTVYSGEYTQAEFEALMASIGSGELYFGSDLTLTADLEIPEGLNVTFQGGSMTVPKSKTLTIHGSLTVFNTMTVKKGGSLVLEGSGILCVPGAVFTIESGASYVIRDDAHINASDGTTLNGISRGETINSNMIMDPSTDLESFAALGSEYKKFLLSIVTDYTIREDVNLPANVALDHQYFTVTIDNGATVTINNDWNVGADYDGPGGTAYPGYIVVKSGSTLILNGSLNLVFGSQLLVEEGGKVINNGALNLNAPFGEDTAAIFNGEFINNGQFWLTTESHADINGYAVSSGPIFVGFGGNSRLNINGQLDTCAYMAVNEGGSLNLAPGAKLNLLGQGGGYLDNAGYCYLGGDVYIEGLMTSGARTDEETGAVVGSEATIEIRGSVTGSDTSSIGVGEGGSIQCFGPVTTAGEVVVGKDGAFWVDHTVTLTGPAPLTVDGWLHIDFFDEYADANGLLNLETTANVNGYLHVCDGGVLNVTDKAVLNILNDENGCGYLDNQGHVGLHGTMNLDGLFTTGPAVDENGNVVGNPADTELRGSISASDRSFIGVGTQGSLYCYGPVTTAGEVTIDPEGALWVDNTVSITGPGALRNNGYLHIDYFDEFATADGVLNVDTETHVNGYLHVCDGGSLHMGENSTLGIYNNENGCGYLDNQGTAIMDGHLYLEGLFTTGAACDENGNVVGEPASAQFNWYVDTTETSFFGVLKDGTVTLFGVNNAGEFRTEDGGRLIFPENVFLENHGGMVAMAEDTLQYEGFGLVLNHMIDGSLGSVSGVPYEHLGADVHAYNADQVYRLFEIASPEEYSDITVIVEDSMVLDRDLTIPEVGFINLLAREVPTLTVTIPEGVTVTNNGYIYVLENTKLVIDGVLDGNPPENMGGTITGSNAALTSETLYDKLVRNGHVDLRSRLVLNSDLTIPGGTVLNITEGGQLIVPGGKALIVEGELHVTNSVDKEGNGEAGLLLQSGKLVNNGLVAVHDLGILDASNGTYEQADWAQVDLVYLGDDNDSQIPFAPSETIGIPLNCITLIADYTNPEVIRVVLRIAEGAAADNNPFGHVRINIGRDMALSEDMTIPENGCMRIENSTVTVPAGLTLTNEGRIEIGWNGRLVVEGTLEGYQPWTTGGGEYITADVYTEAELRADISEAAQAGGQLFLCRHVTLTNDLTVPAGMRLTIGLGGQLTVPEGVTLTVEGELQVVESAADENVPGLLLDGGKLVNNNMVITEGFGIIDASNGTYEQADWAQLQRIYHYYEESGLHPSDVIGIPNHYVTLIAAEAHAEVIRVVLAIADHAEEIGDPFHMVQIDLNNRELRLTEDLTIPKYAWIRVSDFGTLIVPEDVTLTNRGGIDIYWAGTVIVEEGGTIIGNHPTCVDTGAEYINENFYTQDDLETLIAEHLDQGYAVLSVPVTLERNLTVPADFTLIISGRDNFITIPQGTSLTNYGTIACQMFGGILAQGGSLSNAGMIHVLNWGTVDMWNGTYESMGGMVYNQHYRFSGGYEEHATVVGFHPSDVEVLTYGDEDSILHELIDFINHVSQDGIHSHMTSEFIGDMTLTGNLYWPGYGTMNIPEGITVVIPEGITLTNAGTINVFGQLIVEGTLENYGQVIADNPGCIIGNVGTGIIVPGTEMEDYTIGCDSTAVSVGGGVELRIENVEPAYAEYYGLYDLEILSGEGWIDEHTVRSNTPGTVTVAVKPVVGHDAENGYAPIYSENIKTIDISFMEATAEAWWDGDFFQDEVCGIGIYAGSKLTMGGMLFDHTSFEELEGTARLEIQGANQFVTIKENANGTVTISSNKNMTEAVVLTVTSIPVETHGLEVASTTHYLVIRPKADSLDIRLENASVTGSTVTVDLNGDPVRQLRGVVAPFDAVPVNGLDPTGTALSQWTSSNEAVATVDQNGTVTFTGEPGTVKITLTTEYGAKKTASVTFKAMDLPKNLLPSSGTVTELIGGKASTYAVTDEKGNALGAKEVQWFLSDELGNPIGTCPYASINAKGKLTTKAVADPYEVYIMAKVAGIEDGAQLSEPITVTLYPAVTAASIRIADPQGDVVNGKSLRLDSSSHNSMQLYADVAPCAESVKSISWKSSKTAVAEIDETGLLTLTGAGKTKITLTVEALDGKKTTATCEFLVGAFVRDITVTAKLGDTQLDLSEDPVIYSGEKITFSATTEPAEPTTAGVKWSIRSSDKAYASIKGSVLTAKKVTNRVCVSVIYESKDGNYINEIPVIILPKPVQVGDEVKDALLIQNDIGEFITKTTVTMIPGSDAWLYATDEIETWESGKPTVADIDDNGHLVAKANGTAKITATAYDGRTAELTVKVTKIADSIEISTKKGEPFTVASGKALNLVGIVTYSDDSTDKKVTWSLDWNDCGAKISGSGKLTAPKGLTEATTVAAVATSKDGAVMDYVIIDIVPAASGLEIYGPFGSDCYDVDVSNTNQKWDLTTQGNTFYLYAGVFPMDAMQEVTWKSSSSKVASVDAEGRVTCLKPGTATITATAADGSGRKASFKLTVAKSMAYLELPQSAFIGGGKSLTMTKLVGFAMDNDAANKKLNWILTDLDGNPVSKNVATLSGKGVLKANKKVASPVDVLVRVEAADGSGLFAECVVTIFPVTKGIALYSIDRSDELVDVTGKTVSAPINEGYCILTDTTNVAGFNYSDDKTADEFLPNGSAWEISESPKLRIEYDGQSVCFYPTEEARVGDSVRVTLKALDGSGKSAAVTLNFTEAVYTEPKTIGISMPSSHARWVRDAETMVDQLSEMNPNCTIEVMYANNSVETQYASVEHFIAEEVDCLVIACIDPYALVEPLASAKEAGIPVIAYDRLLLDTDAVSYYTTFDNWAVGVLQGEYIVDALNLENAGSKTYNIEYVTGDLDDNNATIFFDGALSVLQPYIDAGTLVCPSGQTTREETATKWWDTANAQARFEDILANHYSDGTHLDVVLSSNDTLALGVANALTAFGMIDYVLTGQDCDLDAVRNIVSGTQSMSVFKDSDIMSRHTAEMIVDIVSDREPEINDTTGYHNGSIYVPTYLCPPAVVTADNYEELLIDTGYYTEEDIRG